MTIRKVFILRYCKEERNMGRIEEAPGKRRCLLLMMKVGLSIEPYAHATRSWLGLIGGGGGGAFSPLSTASNFTPFTFTLLQLQQMIMKVGG